MISLKRKSHTKYIRDASGKIVDVQYTGDIDKKSSLSPQLQMKIKKFEELEKQKKTRKREKRKQKIKKGMKKINRALDVIDPKVSHDRYGKKKKRSDDPMNPTGIKWR